MSVLPPSQSHSHGEALTIEPLLIENKEGTFWQDFSILAVATVTQVMILSILPDLRGLTSLPLRVRAIGTYLSSTMGTYRDLPLFHYGYV